MKGLFNTNNLVKNDLIRRTETKRKCKRDSLRRKETEWGKGIQ